ncbi:MAG: hypothetical protein MI757_07065 [Pirellulales bacterium]|nr:hypothetical protein [Pirellulales bacterium]
MVSRWSIALLLFLAVVIGLMMSFDWQSIAALAITAVAAGFLVRRCFNKGSGCGSCSSKAETGMSTKQIVSVDELTQSRLDV